MLQASRALLYLHGLSCVHRDFKPANVLLRADLHAMLADTGFAKAAFGDGDVAGTKHASITSRGVCHTTGYGKAAAAEQRTFRCCRCCWLASAPLLMVPRPLCRLLSRPAHRQRRRLLGQDRRLRRGRDPLRLPLRSARRLRQRRRL